MKTANKNIKSEVKSKVTAITKIGKFDTKKRRTAMAVAACAVLLTVFSDITPSVSNISSISAEASKPAGVEAGAVKGGTGEFRSVPVKEGMVRDLVSVTGAVKSVDSENVYSYLPYQVQTILHDTGDKVKVGDILAVLDTDDLEYDVRAARSNYEQSLSGADNEQRSIGNGVVNAQTAYEQAVLALQSQQLSYDNAVRDAEKFSKDSAEAVKNRELEISNAKLAVERTAVTLANAEKDVKYAEDDLVTAKNDVKTAQTDLDDAHKNFKPFSYDNSLADAEKAYKRAVDDYAEQKAKTLEETDEYVKLNNALTDANRSLKAAKPSENLANMSGDAAGAIKGSLSRIDAENAIDRATDLLAKGEKDWRDGRNDVLLTYERAVTDTKHTLDRAKESKKLAQDDWNESQDDSVKNAEKQLTKMLTAQDTAQKNIERTRRALVTAKQAQIDARRAYDDALDGTGRTLKNEKAALENAKLSVVAAQNALAQAKAQEATSNPESAKINVEKLEKTLRDGVIKATASGVITENNAKIGANPAGVMFVIEDTEHLYVSANVKEYVVGKIEIGQKVDIQTDATGDDILSGTVTYISPKAVSGDGNTSVEFEVWAKLDKFDPRVRIGMNGFIDIVTATADNTLYIPSSSILTQDDNGSPAGGDYIFVASKDVPMSAADFSKIKVDVALRTSSNAAISGTGVAAGNYVAADPDAIQALIDNPPPVKKGLFAKKASS